MQLSGGARGSDSSEGRLVLVRNCPSADVDDLMGQCLLIRSNAKCGGVGWLRSGEQLEILNMVDGQ